MKLRWLALSSTVALAPPAAAQSPTVLGREDAAFARGLYRHNWADLAEKLCDLIEKRGNLTPEANVGVKALHLDLRLDLAGKEPDLIKRKDLIRQILEQKEDLVHQYPAMKEAQEAANTLPDAYRTLGETITMAIQKEKDVKKVAALQGEGQQIYSKAEDQLRAQMEELEQDHSAPEQERQYMIALYNLPRTLYFHSLLYPAGEWKKKDLLEKAAVGFQQFGLAYNDRILYFEGLIY